MHELRVLMSMLSSRARRRFVWLLVATFASGFLQLLGVGSVLPFMAFVAEPELTRQSEKLNFVFETLGFTSTRSFLLFLGAVMFVALTLSNIVTAAASYLGTRLSSEIQHELSTRLLDGYLARPYSWCLNRNSADLAKNVLAEVNLVTGSYFLPFTQALLSLTTSGFLVGLIFMVEPRVALVATTLLAGFYMLLYRSLRNRLTDFGKQRLAANMERYRSAYEALGAAKDIRVFHCENSFLSRYRDSSYDHSEITIKVSWLSAAPKYLTETVAFGGIIAIILHLVYRGAQFNTVLPLLSLYAICGVRVIPALQRAFRAVALFRVNVPVVQVLHQHFEEAGNVGVPTEPTQPMPFREAIKLRDVSFTYPGSERPVLKGISCSIPRNASVAFAGGTGAGKTTVIDIILGLLLPDDGQVLIDGVKLNEGSLRAWQRNVAYVPQEIMLIDDTIERNIAFGIPESEIDRNKVEHAAKLANIHNFIAQELEADYKTTIGERGVRLSGGQRQRLGIARALYNEPPVIVFDEATSALDGATESAVMEAIDQLSASKTIILIAHRLTTLRNCDVIYLLEGGRIIDQGSYTELVERSRYFGTDNNSTNHANGEAKHG